MSINLDQYYSLTDESKKLIREAVQNFSHQAVLTSSFGTHSATFIHFAATYGLQENPVVFIKHPFTTPETLEFAETLRKLYKLDVRVYEAREQHPIEEVRQALLDNTPRADYYRYFYKREPLERALSDLNARAWISGVRRDETPDRAELQPIMQREDSLFLIYPLLAWSEKYIDEHIYRYSLPRNRAYFDIFKETHAKKECGIHDFVRCK